MSRRLTSTERQSLLVEYEDGWSINELTIIYRVSTRTVFRILAEGGVRKVNPRLRGKRKVPKKKPRELKPCGTNAAYQRHRRKGEYPCAPCLEAHAKENK